jgi:hypothetical protein
LYGGKEQNFGFCHESNTLIHLESSFEVELSLRDDYWFEDILTAKNDKFRMLKGGF